MIATRAAGTATRSAWTTSAGATATTTSGAGDVVSKCLSAAPLFGTPVPFRRVLLLGFSSQTCGRLLRHSKTELYCFFPIRPSTIDSLVIFRSITSPPKLWKLFTLRVCLVHSRPSSNIPSKNWTIQRMLDI